MFTVALLGKVAVVSNEVAVVGLVVNAGAVVVITVVADVVTGAVVVISK